MDKEKNIFKEAREKKNYSIRKLSELTNVNRGSLRAVDEGNLESVKFEDIIIISQKLEINISKFIRDRYGHTSGEIYEEEMATIVSKLVEIQLDLVCNELKTFASLTDIRIDDFDITNVLRETKNLHRLIILNKQLKSNEISKKIALKQFPPIKGPFNKRKK